MRNSAFLTATVCLILTGCVARTVSDVSFASNTEFNITIAPNDHDQAFALTLTSNSLGPLCLDIDQWPNSLGQLHMGSERAQVTADGRTYPAADRNFGYCVGPRCSIRIVRGEQLHGHIAYSEFQGWPHGEGAAAAHLSFSVRPWHC